MHSGCFIHGEIFEDGESIEMTMAPETIMNNESEKVRMYFIAVVLPTHLDEKILEHKKYMKEKYGCKVGLKSPAHITIVPPFWLKEENETSLVHDMETIARAVPPFTLTTANFSAFKPRTVFVAVEQSSELQALKKASDTFFRHSAYKIKAENRPFHPHITIATRDLHKKDFAEAWPLFETMEFMESFEALGLSLLKHNGKAWDVVFTAPFSNPLPTDDARQP